MTRAHQIKGKLKYIQDRLKNVKTQKDIKYKGEYYFKELWLTNDLINDLINDLENDIDNDIRKFVNTTFDEWVNRILE